MPRVTVTALRGHYERQQIEGQIAGQGWNSLGLVFCSTKGTPIDPRNFKRSLDAALKRADLHHIRIHDMRHTAASLMIAQKVEPKLVSETLGHTRIGTTYDIYGHLFEPMRREAADKMDEILRGLEPLDEAS